MRRHQRIRKKVSGTSERPRMAIMVSNKQMYVQFINDHEGRTLASASTLGAEGVRGVDAARQLGRDAAAAALANGIGSVVVDRGGFTYHGRLKAIVEGALEAGLSTGSGGAVADADETAPAEETALAATAEAGDKEAS